MRQDLAECPTYAIARIHRGPDRLRSLSGCSATWTLRYSSSALHQSRPGRVVAPRFVRAHVHGRALWDAGPVRARQLIAIAVAALAARALYIVIWLRHYRPDSDADNYDALARALAHGRGFVQTLPFDFVHPTAGRPPLFPVALGGLYKLFGTHVATGQALNVALGCGVAVLAAMTAARIAGPTAGLAPASSSRSSRRSSRTTRCCFPRHSRACSCSRPCTCSSMVTSSGPDSRSVD
jgi:hypothetical protein